jgi:cytochrome c oxidase assembly factor CtaG
MDAPTTPAPGMGWAIAILVVFLFLWLIPLFHASRSGRAMPIIEVLLLLGTSILMPVGVGTLSTGGSAFVGAIFLAPMVGVAGVLWFAALFIALAAELGEALRPPRSRYPPPRRIQEGDRYP